MNNGFADRRRVVERTVEHDEVGRVRYTIRRFGAHPGGTTLVAGGAVPASAARPPWSQSSRPSGVTPAAKSSVRSGSEVVVPASSSLAAQAATTATSGASHATRSPTWRAAPLVVR